MKIRDMMTEQPATCSSDTPLQDVATMMRDNDCGMIPIIEHDGNNRVIGTVTDRDIVIRTLAEGNNPMQMTAGDVMSDSPFTINPEASEQEADKMMSEHKVRRLLVTDDSGNLVGVLAQADIARQQPEDETGRVVKEISSPSQRPRA